MTMMIEKIDLGDGNEIAVYQDRDGYHAERWDDARQWVAAQSGDFATAAEAVAAVSPLED